MEQDGTDSSAPLTRQLELWWHLAPAERVRTKWGGRMNFLPSPNSVGNNIKIYILKNSGAIPKFIGGTIYLIDVFFHLYIKKYLYN